MEPVVELKNLTHVYVNDREASLAVEGLNLTVHPGEFISLVGPSGCGKTTILSMIAGLLHPTNGEVLVYGRKVEGPSPDVGYMLQQDYLFPWRTILQNAAIGLEVTGRLQLSGGMRQRVALVRTLPADPGLLLLDEPFSALDYQTKLQLEDLIAGTLREKNKTAILVTHDLSEAVAVSDRVVLLGKNPGRIRRTFEVPGHIRETQPFYARKEEGFNELFHEIWREMESEED